MKYKSIINDYIYKCNKTGSYEDIYHFLNKIFFIYPSLKVSSEQLSNIIQDISDNFGMPFHNIKVIGSSHLGFSFIKPKNSNEVKLFDKGSDIDIAIINKDLFYEIFCDTFAATNAFMDNTKFKKVEHQKMFKDNLLKGYIRPDTIADIKIRTDWLRFFKELSISYKVGISAAIYLNENTFHQKIIESFKIYERKVLSNGTK